ncbi:MAG: NADPH-dependent FMN reductase [Planctomycetota bacterium]
MTTDPAQPGREPRVLVLSTSLHPHSRSRILAEQARISLAHRGAQVAWFDCRDVQLPYMDGHGAHGHEGAQALQRALGACDAALIATGIYNYDVSAVAKACMELGGRAWNDKTVGIACAAGSMVSYMAHMGLANSLMLDFRCVIVPRFVYATGDAFKDGALSDEGTQARLAELCGSLVDLARRRM